MSVFVCKLIIMSRAPPDHNSYRCLRPSPYRLSGQKKPPPPLRRSPRDAGRDADAPVYHVVKPDDTPDDTPGVVVRRTKTQFGQVKYEDMLRHDWITAGMNTEDIIASFTMDYGRVVIIRPKCVGDRQVQRLEEMVEKASGFDSVSVCRGC